MAASNATGYLVNTGWNGTGKRISLSATRKIIDAILDDSIEQQDFQQIPVFNLAVPLSLPGVDANLLDPRSTYQDAGEWEVVFCGVQG